MIESDDEKGSPLRRKIPETYSEEDGDATKRSLNMNEMEDIEQYLSEKGAETIDERIDYLKEIDPNEIDPDLEKLGIKSAVDRDTMIRAEESLKAAGPIIANIPAIQATAEMGAIIANNPAFQATAEIAAAMQHYSAEIAKFSSTLQDIANIRSTIPNIEHLNIPAAMNQAKDNPAIPNRSPLEYRSRPFLPNLDFPEPPKIEPIFPKMEENQWKRHNELLALHNKQLESLRDTYKILAADAKTNQDALNEQKRTTRVTWAVLGVGVVSTLGLVWTEISQNRSLISDPTAFGIMLILALIWIIVIAYIKNGGLLPKKSKADQHEARGQTAK